MALIDETAFESDLCQRGMRLRHEGLGENNPLSDKPGVRRDPDRVGESPDEIAHGQPASASEIRDHNGFPEFRAHGFLRQPLLPRCQARPRRRVDRPAITPSRMGQERRRALALPRNARVEILAGLQARLAAIATPGGTMGRLRTRNAV